MNLFLRECKSNLKSLCIWCLGMLALLGTGTGKMSAMIKDGAESITTILKDMPRVMQNMFGIGVVDFSKAIGIYSIMILYIAIIVGFHASSVGTSCFAKEERDKTYEFLYVKGMKRRNILGVKVLVSFLQLLILNAVTYGFSVAMVKAVLKENIAKDFLPMMVGMLLLQLTYYAIGLLLSFLTRSQKKASSISFGIVMMGFLFAMFSDFTEFAEFLKYLTPFKYFDGKEILVNGLNLFYSLLCLVITVVCIGISFVLHEKRNLQ